MQIVGIVAEYNPFHNGHAYQMAVARAKSGAEGVVVAMGGNYTQRGEFALMNKFSRAEAAVRCGADLVIELPLPFSVAGAERFATGGISLLGEFCQTISCGCETDDSVLLEEITELLCDDTVRNQIFDRVKSGEAYAVAVERVLGDYHKSYAELIRTPNNILACEYKKAIRNLGLSMPLIPVTRRGAEHNSEQSDGRFASASLIRSLPVCEVIDYLPMESAMILKREAEAGRVMRAAPEVAMLSYLRRLEPGELAEIVGCGEGLEYRVYEALRTETTLSAVINRVTTKRYPAARIRRLLLSAYLDIKSTLLETCLLPPYIRVLAFNDTGRKILSKHKKDDGRPILTKGAHYSSLSPAAIELFEKEALADDLYTSAYPEEAQRKCGISLTTSPYYKK